MVTGNGGITISTLYIYRDETIDTRTSQQTTLDNRQREKERTQTASYTMENTDKPNHGRHQTSRLLHQLIRERTKLLERTINWANTGGY